MARYARLVERALAFKAGGLNAAVIGLPLAPPQSVARCFGRRLGNWFHHAWIEGAARRLRRRVRADVFHILDGSHAYVADHLPPRCVVATCHDLIPLLQMRGVMGPPPGALARRLIARSASALARVQGIIADSANTQRDLAALTGVRPERTAVVYPALDPNLLALAGDGRAAGRYVLHVGHDAFYKNREGVLRIFTRVAAAADVRLMLAGPPLDRHLRLVARRLGVADRITVVPEADDHRLAALYGDAGLLLFPSLYEGFGWPVLEAMAFGCPVVCATAASLPELAGGVALAADVADEAGLADRCLAILGNRDRAADLGHRGVARAAEFSLERMAAGLGTAYRAALQAKP